MLHSKTPEKLAPFLDTLYPALLRMLSDSADEVVRLDLKVLAKLSSQSESAYFDKLMHNLVSLFYSDQQVCFHSSAHSFPYNACLGVIEHATT